MLSAHAQNDTEFIIYLPEDYIEKLRTEITNGAEKVKPITEIENFQEEIKPVDPVLVYLPDEEVKKLKDNTIIPVNQSTQNILLAENSLSKDDIIRHEAPQIEVEKEERLNFKEIPAAKASDVQITSVTTIKGKVTNEQGEPLIGATIAVKGTNTAAITDYDGNFSLNAGTESPELTANYIGFEPVDIKNPEANQNIVMKENRLALDEVVVIGYGTQKRSSLTGAVSSVSAKDKETFYTDKAKVKVKPQPIGGEKQYKEYLKKNFVKPADADCNATSGKITVEFFVDNNGNPKDINITKGVCDAYNEAAIELIENGPKWTTGTEKVKVVVEF
jgi:hypothetical protein